MEKVKNIKKIDIHGNNLAPSEFALVQIGDRDIGSAQLPFPHYYYEENLSAADLFIEIYDLLEHYQNIKIIY